MKELSEKNTLHDTNSNPGLRECMRVNLEVCVDSTSSALAAVRGGADRIELCGNLIIGGTTPSPCLFKNIREHTDIRTHVLKAVQSARCKGDCDWYS